MGKVTGFMEYQRLAEAAEDKRERVKHYREFVLHLSDQEAASRARAAWIAAFRSA